MRLKIQLVAVLLGLIALSSMSAAADKKNDLVNCIWHNGNPMDPRDCNELRRYEAKKQADAERGRQLLEKSRKEVAQHKAEQDVLQAQHQAAIDAADKKRVEELARQEEEAQKYREQMAREGAAEEEALKKKCGKDYRSLRIGMSFERVEQCFEALDLEATTKTENGVIQTYSSTFFLISFMNGQVISYTRQ